MRNAGCLLRGEDAEFVSGGVLSFSSSGEQWVQYSTVTGVRPKGAGGASALPRKNISACRNENRATVGTGMKVLFGQKLEVCWNQHKFINCETSLELDISKCRYLMFNSRHPYKTQQRHPQPARQRSAPLGATVHSSKCKMLRYHSFDDFVGRKIL